MLLECPAGGGTPAPAAMTACPSSCSLPPPALSQEGIELEVVPLAPVHKVLNKFSVGQAYPKSGLTAAKKRKVDKEGRRFQDKWKLEYFFTEI